MEIREIAKKAMQLYTDENIIPSMCALDRFALLGYLYGVAEGDITVGQSWAGSLMRAASLDKTSVEYSISHVLNSDQYKIVFDVFSSGICCEGQMLGGERGKSFVDRTA